MKSSPTPINWSLVPPPLDTCCAQCLPCLTSTFLASLLFFFFFPSLLFSVTFWPCWKVPGGSHSPLGTTLICEAVRRPSSECRPSARVECAHSASMLPPFSWSPTCYIFGLDIAKNLKFLLWAFFVAPPSTSWWDSSWLTVQVCRLKVHIVLALKKTSINILQMTPMHWLESLVLFGLCD